MQRKRIIMRGRVQGVGFRPFIYRLAHDAGLTGFVENSSSGVIIEIQGTETCLAFFEENFERRLPPLACITDRQESAIPTTSEDSFVIRASSQSVHAGHSVLVSPDIALCTACRSDMTTAGNRRRGYAFTNCTDCGPRYTITRSIPYDRTVTSMACFPMCGRCREEYGDPLDRRFHAQPNACPQCGPRLWACDADGRNLANGNDAIALCVRTMMTSHAIAAIKGMGGFQLACNAFDAIAVETLRKRKNRPHKALAVMVENIAAARVLAEITPTAEMLLASPAAPIVLCKKRTDCTLPENLAPDTDRIGIMLPSTPLHLLLFRPDLLDDTDGRSGRKNVPAPKALVMTSGNAGGEPICLRNRDAADALKAIADLFLFHDRDILVRVDDSVVLPSEPPVFFRRARGYVPSPVAFAGQHHDAAALGSSCTLRRSAADLPMIKGQELVNSQPRAEASAISVLGFGAQLKSTFCLTRGREAFVSQHIGSLEHESQASFFKETLEHLQKLLEVTPSLAVCDEHPDYLSSELARQYAGMHGIPLITLQHHAAHAFAVLAEHTEVRRPVLALALDGSGYGPDGTIWGGEILYVDPTRAAWRRAARLTPFPLPGGDAAVRNPWRIAYALLAAMPRDIADKFGIVVKSDGIAYRGGKKTIPFPWDAGKAETAMLDAMLDNGINTPLTSSCGRLFDAVSALCGLCRETSYEGQAAIRLENASHTPAEVSLLTSDSRYWSIDWRDLVIEDWLVDYDIYEILSIADEIETGSDNGSVGTEINSFKLFAEIIATLCDGGTPSDAAIFFHNALAAALAETCAVICGHNDIKHVVFCGGVFNNETLTTLLRSRLRKENITVLQPAEIPTGDGGISLGQAYYGWLKTERGQ